MQKFYKTKQFNELKQAWDKILENSGFVDIEKEKNGERVLKTCSMSIFYRRGPKNIEITDLIKDHRQSYYQLLAEHVAKELAFEDESDRIIMQRTSEGYKISEISLELKALNKAKFNRDTIRYVRRRYENKWGIKNWKPEQMVSRKPTKS